jgi:FAD/FMN-containing dehydrogenase
MDIDVSTLRTTVTGAVMQPAEPGYADEVATFNLAYRQTPDVVVAAESAEDVAVAVRWAADHDLPVGVQATGHNPAEPVTSGLLVSTRAMSDVRVDPATKTARVAAGVQWRDLLDAAAEHGLAGLCGSTSDVGVVGYTLGGGLPVLGRAYGLCAEHVRSFEVVTGTGQIQTVHAGDGSELDWGLRGGKGNLGIVTALELELFEAAELYGGPVFFKGEDAPTLLPAFAEWTDALPESFCASLALLRLPPLPDIPEPLRGQFVVNLRVAYLGDETEGNRLLAPMRAAARPILDGVGIMPYSALDQIHQDPDHPVPAREGSVLLRGLPAEAIATLLEIAGPGTACPLLDVELRHLGGALARPAAGAVDVSDAAYALITIGLMAPPVAEMVPDAIANLRAAMAPWSTGRSLLNMHGEPGDAPERSAPWSSEAYARLQRAKASLDPANLFRFGHAVEPAPAVVLS